MRRHNPTPLLLFLVACGGVDSEPQIATSAAQLEAENFCTAYANAMCDSRAACECSMREACYDENVAACERGILTHDAMIAIGYGAIQYDPVAAWRVVESIQSAADSCESSFEVLGWTHGDLLDFGGMLRGQVAEGEKCTIPNRTLGPNECDNGVCMEVEGQYRCVAVASAGESCSADSLCMDRAAPLGAEIARRDFMFTPCVEGQCQPRGVVDDACKDDSRCESYRCLRQVSPTTRVDVAVHLDRDEIPMAGSGDPEDLAAYQRQVAFEIADADGRMHLAEVYFMQLGPHEWTYRAVVQQDIFAVGILIFDPSGALLVDYAIRGGASFAIVDGVEFDFGDSVEEGGDGLGGTVLSAAGYEVRSVTPNHAIGQGFCAPKAVAGETCSSNVQCASGACDGVCLKANAELGDVCDWNRECASGACVDGRCGAAWCR